MVPVELGEIEVFEVYARSTVVGTRGHIDNPPRTILNMFWVLLVEMKLLYKKRMVLFQNVFRGNL